MKHPYLLFDAGGTLVFPDQDLMAREAAAEGCPLDPERIQEAHFRLIYLYDLYVREKSKPLPVSLPKFYTKMLTVAGMPDSAAGRVVERLMTRHEETSLWTYTKPWVAETLEVLKRLGIRMSVISNSDGRVRQQLEACGIAPYLEAVFDSGIVGIEKPDPGLFVHALNELGLAPADAVYVGDMFYFDVLGANRAGVGAVHLDPLGCYAEWPGLHLRDIRALPDWIMELSRDGSPFDLFPARGQ